MNVCRLAVAWCKQIINILINLNDLFCRTIIYIIFISVSKSVHRRSIPDSVYINLVSALCIEDDGSVRNACLQSKFYCNAVRHVLLLISEINDNNCILNLIIWWFFNLTNHRTFLWYKEDTMNYNDGHDGPNKVHPAFTTHGYKYVKYIYMYITIIKLKRPDCSMS